MTALEDAVDDFLASFDTLPISDENLNKVWKAFMAYCMCIIAVSMKRKQYLVNSENCPEGFRFKCHTRGNPNLCSWFHISKDNEDYELRMNVDCRNNSYANSLKLNLDILLIKSNSIRNEFKGYEQFIVSTDDMLFFCECKNVSAAYPELVAGFEGMVFETQSERLYRRGANQYRFPCCLLTSGRASTVSYKNDYFLNYNRSLRIYGDFVSGSSVVSDFITNWFN